MGSVDGLTITVDVQERRSAVPAALAEMGVEVAMATLPVGDYAIGGRVVERKSIADLHHSLVDGRIWGQVRALRRDPRRAYLLAEGADLDDGSVPARPLRGALLKIMDNGIGLIRTSSPEDSAVWLRVLAAQEHRRLARTTIHTGRRPIVRSPAGLLSTIPGISPECAALLLARFGSIAGVAEASEADLRSVRGIGPGRARSLVQALSQART